MQNVNRSLLKLTGELALVDISCITSVATWGLVGRVTKLASNTGTLAAKSNAVANAANQAADSYQAAEDKLSGVESSSSGGTTGGQGESGGQFDWSQMWKFVGSAGLIGSGVSTIGQLIAGGLTWANGIKTAGNVSKFIGSVAKAFPKDGGKFEWSKLWGGNKPADPTSSFWGNFGKEFDKYSFGKAETLGDKIAAGAKWAGLLFTGIATTYDNFTDTSENNSFWRKVAESAGETAVKVGEGMLIGAAVAAAIGSAPAVVVGAATVGVTWLVDSAVERITGKDTAELISDAVLDGAEWLGDKASKAGKWIGNKVGNAVSSFGKKIGVWWNKGYSGGGSW